MMYRCTGLVLAFGFSLKARGCRNKICDHGGPSLFSSIKGYGKVGVLTYGTCVCGVKPVMNEG